MDESHSLYNCAWNGSGWCQRILLVLLLGLVSTGIVGMAYGTFDVFGWFGALGKGMTLGMGELIIVTPDGRRYAGTDTF